MKRKRTNNGAKGPSVDLQVTPFASDAPAPKTKALVASLGEELSTVALEAWAGRVGGESIIEVAYRLGVTIESARELIKETSGQLNT